MVWRDDVGERGLHPPDVNGVRHVVGCQLGPVDLLGPIGGKHRA